MATFAEAYEKVQEAARLLRAARQELEHLPEEPIILRQLRRAEKATTLLAQEVAK